MVNQFNKSVKVPDDILYQELSNGEIVFLNLDNESYYGLDDVGSAIWDEITSTEDLETAFNNLLDKFDVTPDKLRKDLEILLNQMVENGILEYSKK